MTGEFPSLRTMLPGLKYPSLARRRSRCVRDRAIQVHSARLLPRSNSNGTVVRAVGSINDDSTMESESDHETELIRATSRTPGRLRTWSRRLGLALLVLLVSVTLAALGFDLATNGREQPASALYRGPFVRADRTTLAYRRWGEHGVAGIVLLDGDALAFGGNHGWLANLLVYPYYTAIYRIVTGSDWIVGRVLRHAWGPKPAATSHAALAQFERPFRVQGTDSALRQLFAGGIPGLTLRQLARLHVARAVIWGAEDNVDSLASGRSTAAALHTRLQTVRQAGHLSMLAAPRATAERILRFIASLPHVKRTT